MAGLWRSLYRNELLPHLMLIFQWEQLCGKFYFFLHSNADGITKTYHITKITTFSPLPLVDLLVSGGKGQISHLPVYCHYTQVENTIKIRICRKFFPWKSLLRGILRGNINRALRGSQYVLTEAIPLFLQAAMPWGNFTSHINLLCKLLNRTIQLRDLIRFQISKWVSQNEAKQCIKMRHE